MKKAIFVDRDGTIIVEPADEQIDTLEKLEFVPGAIGGLRSLRELGEYEIVLASNQDGLGSTDYTWDQFNLVESKVMKTLEGEGVFFDDKLYDYTRAEEHAPTRKPGTGMFGKYLSGEYDLAHSFVIGDRETDMMLARNLGAKGLKIGELSWKQIVETIRSTERVYTVARKTRETDIYVSVDLDGKGESSIDTGLKFFDHMLDQIAHHGGVSLQVKCNGDLQVDEHHTIEDVAIALGTALRQALGNKKGIERYGFALPMDECRAIVLLDFGGRSELVWDLEFTREYVGDMPTEMFRHFFKSLSDEMKCNLYVQARGENNHHLIEGVFKAFARSLRQAVKRDIFSYDLPSSKGLL